MNCFNSPGRSEAVVEGGGGLAVEADGEGNGGVFLVSCFCCCFKRYCCKLYILLPGTQNVPPSVLCSWSKSNSSVILCQNCHWIWSLRQILFKVFNFLKASFLSTQERKWDYPCMDPLDWTAQPVLLPQPYRTGTKHSWRHSLITTWKTCPCTCRTEECVLPTLLVCQRHPLLFLTQQTGIQLDQVFSLRCWLVLQWRVIFNYFCLFWWVPA